MFVLNMLKDPKDMAFAKTLAVLAKEFNIKTITEHIESEELFNAVVSLGIDFAQGYYTGKPTSEITLPPIGSRVRDEAAWNRAVTAQP